MQPVNSETLSSKRTELYVEMCRIFPDFKWGLLFEHIRNQDKDFIQKLKEHFEHREMETISITPVEIFKTIDKLAGDDLIHSQQEDIVDEILSEGSTGTHRQGSNVSPTGEEKIHPAGSLVDTHGSDKIGCTNPVCNNCGVRMKEHTNENKYACWIFEPKTTDNQDCTNCGFSERDHALKGFAKKFLGDIKIVPSPCKEFITDNQNCANPTTEEPEFRGLPDTTLSSDNEVKA